MVGSANPATTGPAGPAEPKGKVPSILDTPQNASASATESSGSSGDEGDSPRPPGSLPGRPAGRPARRGGDVQTQERTVPKLDRKLEGPNDFTAWAKSLKMCLYMYEIDCDFRYTCWDVVSGRLADPTPEQQADLGLLEDEWLRANYFALLTMKKNCEKGPHRLIRLCEYALDAYKILQTHYEHKHQMVSDLGAAFRGVAGSVYSDEGTIDTHIDNFEEKWQKMVTTASGNLGERYRQFGSALKILGNNEVAKIEFLLMTFQSTPAYSQMIKYLRTKDEYSYGDVVTYLKLNVPQVGRFKKGPTTDLAPLRNEAPRDRQGRLMDTSKTCGYCMRVKGWKGIGHTDIDCRTKAREQGQGAVPSYPR